ncbi:MAG: inositol-3-phosphate synthase [Nanobdellota archaeon]
MQSGNRIGLLLVGVNGAIGSTIVAGIDLLNSGKKNRYGLLTESKLAGNTLAEDLDLPDLDEFILGGWDIKDCKLEEALRENSVLKEHDISKVSDEKLNSHFAFSINSCEDTEFGEKIGKIRNDIRRFKSDNNLSKVIVVCLLPSSKNFEGGEIYENTDAFKDACRKGHEHITPSIQYGAASVLEGCAFINYTPNIANVPAVVNMAKENMVPVAGRDGKTGQTYFKTAIAPALKLRELFVQGWYSTNILGNNDGKNLANPDNCKSKIETKQNGLKEILGYNVPDHQVHIHNYMPRKDNKEAWDNIDFCGFLEYPMQLKMNLLAKDSILASPTIIDMARLITIPLREGEGGLCHYFSVFFKMPETEEQETFTQDLFRQRDMLYQWIKSKMHQNDG